MYIPHYYKEEDRAKLIGFMRAHSFGVLISAGEYIHGTHLPFLIEERGEELYLLTHLAKANPQWTEFTKGKELLAIFTGPHGYVSPSNYEKKESVPTWNYVAVHVYGNPVIIADNERTVALLERTIDTFEKAYRDHWEHLPADYKQKMIKGIVAFEMKVTKLEGKYKLSQNKTRNERENIIRAFEKNGDGISNEVAAFMKQDLEK